MKTQKALSKRIKITGSGKILKRPPSQNHFNAKLSGDQKRARHGDKLAPKSLRKVAKALMHTV